MPQGGLRSWEKQRAVTPGAVPGRALRATRPWIPHVPPGLRTGVSIWFLKTLGQEKGRPSSSGKAGQDGSNRNPGRGQKEPSHGPEGLDSHSLSPIERLLGR